MRFGKIAVAGAGLTGSVIARELAEMGYDVVVMESRDHIAGNCYTERDLETGVNIHMYGPHIFHTNNDEVWRYVSQFAEFVPYRHSVVAKTFGETYKLPINLLTLCAFFGEDLTPLSAAKYLKFKSVDLGRLPLNFEEQALSVLGPELYQAFFYHYTVKQWGIEPRYLPADILKRLPVRFNYDDSYFNHRYQGLPRCGYTEFICKILEHPRISLLCGNEFVPGMESDYSHTFYSGTIDSFFRYKYGELPYRTLSFERDVSGFDAQGCAVINYCDSSVPYTRITEHCYLSPWESHEQSVLYREYSRECVLGDIPFYPVNLIRGNDSLLKYQYEAGLNKKISFVGRLGMFSYMDMDVAIATALSVVRQWVNK